MRRPGLRRLGEGGRPRTFPPIFATFARPRRGRSTAGEPSEAVALGANFPAQTVGAGLAAREAATQSVGMGNTSPPWQRLVGLLAALALFGLVLGAKWATVDRFGSAMPDWDQWDAEALRLLVPWFEGDRFLSHLFAPHNEHRVVLTKLQNLALTLLNGQWDARLECVANAALHSLLAVALWLLARRWTAGHWHAPLFALTAVLFGLPLAWENVLSGFHSQQYWLLVLSCAAIVTLPFARPWSAGWWVGAAAAILALGSMASGFLAAAVVAAMVGFRLLRRETVWREAAPTLALAAGLLAIGLVTRVEVYYHQQLKADSAHDFIFSILRSLAWPLRGHDWTGAILWAPWLLVLWHTIRGGPAATRRTPGDAPGPGAPGASLSAGGEAPPADNTAAVRGAQTLVALGGWVLVQILATAYARGAGAHYPSSRYADTLAVGTLVNGIALAWLLSANPGRASRAAATPAARWRPSGWAVALPALGLAWLVFFGAGLRQTLIRHLAHELPDRKLYHVKAESNVRRYLATDDPVHLDAPDIPFTSAEALIERLAHPSLRRLMPAVVRAPLPLAAANAEPAGGETFRRNAAVLLHPAPPPGRGLSPATPPLDHAPTWGSYAPESGAGAVAEWRSGALTSPLGAWLKFEMAGHPGGPGAPVALELHDARTGAALAAVRPSRVPGDAWRAAYVRAPPGPFVVVARDRDAHAWLAFSPPVEMGTLSHRAGRLAQHGTLLAAVSFAAALLAGMVALASNWIGKRKSPASLPKAP